MKALLPGAADHYVSYWKCFGSDTTECLHGIGVPMQFHILFFGLDLFAPQPLTCSTCEEVTHIFFVPFALHAFFHSLSLQRTTFVLDHIPVLCRVSRFGVFLPWPY